MAKQTINSIKNWFRTGLKPTQAQFWDWLDSYFHKDEKIPLTSIDGIQEEFDKKVDKGLIQISDVENLEETLENIQTGGGDITGYMKESEFVGASATKTVRSSETLNGIPASQLSVNYAASARYDNTGKEISTYYAPNTAVSAAITQLIDGASDDTLKKLQDKITALQAIVGSSSTDGDSVVNTVTELLAVFSAFPEGVDIVTVLASKVNVTDVYNALDAVVSGKVLDARQGKVLNDAIAVLSASLANYQLIVDNTFNTTSKNVPGAVNEVYDLAIKEIFAIAIDSAIANATPGLKYTDRFPFPFTLLTLHLNLGTAASGSTFQVDVKKNGVSVFTTKLTVDATEKTSKTAAVPYVLTTPTIAFTTDDEYAVIIDQVGAVVAGKNPVLYMLGKKTI
jgi:hypothetical protein